MMVRALVFLAVLTAPWLVLAQPEMLSEDATKEYRKNYEDYRLMKSIGLHNPVGRENRLRGDVISYWYRENIDKRLRWFRRQDWSPEYKAMFVRAVRWHKEAFNGGAEKLYRLSEEYQIAPNARKYGYVLLSGRLLGRAAMAGHEKSMKKILDHPEMSIWPPTLKMTPRAHYQGAVSGLNGARVLLAAKYLNDPVFEIDRIKGYYWYSLIDRSRLAKKTVQILEKNIAWISSDQRQQAADWIKSGHVPPM